MTNIYHTFNKVGFQKFRNYFLMKLLLTTLSIFRLLTTVSAHAQTYDKCTENGEIAPCVGELSSIALAHLSQYFSIIIAPSVLYLTILVAKSPHPI